jgi:hypothetical protein
MNKKADTLSEDDGDDDKEQYVAVEEQEQQDDTKVEASDHDDDDQEDSRLDADNEDREELRRKRREEKAERAQRRKAAIERDKAELAFLRQQNEEMLRRLKHVEHKTASQDFRMIDSRLNEAIEEARAAEHIIAQAVEAGNGADVAKAMRIRDEALKVVQQLEHAKAQFKAPSSQQPQQQKQPQVTQGDLAARLAQDWIKMNPWYDPQSNDERSKKVLEIDQSLADEGYNPNSLEYWRELDRRVETQLTTKKRGGPPVGSSRGDTPRANRNEVYISPERKQAMIDAGVWDDPQARQRYLKAYAQWDRDNNAAR